MNKRGWGGYINLIAVGHFPSELAPASPTCDKCRHTIENRVKTIDFMTRNRQLYPALSNDSVFYAIKETEKQLKNLHYSIIPSTEVDKAAADYLKSGDIVAIVTDKQGLDVSHVGVLRIENGIPYLTHASSKYKKVINDTLPLKTYLTRQKSPGIRVFRLDPN